MIEYNGPEIEYFEKCAAKHNLDFAAYLAASAMEEVFCSLSECEQKKNLWLKNESFLWKQNKLETKRLLYEFVYRMSEKDVKRYEGTKEELFDDQMLALSRVIQEKTRGQLFEKTVTMSKTKHYKEMAVLCVCKELQVPLTVRVSPLYDDKMLAKKEEYPLITQPDKTLQYYCYPTEVLLAERFMEITTKLELIQDMSAYYDVFFLLNHESVDGRKVKDYIRILCDNKNIKMDKNRVEHIVQYEEYPYMRKKWKSFLRPEKATELKWSDVIERFVHFYHPIWDAIVEDRVFFGDWMPELNRFL